MVYKALRGKPDCSCKTRALLATFQDLILNREWKLHDKAKLISFKGKESNLHIETQKYIRNETLHATALSVYSFLG